MQPKKFLAIGFIKNVHGVHGEVRVIPLTDDPERYGSIDWVYLDHGVSESVMPRLNIEYFKILISDIIMKFKGIDDRDAAMTIKGAYLKIDRENAVKLPEGSYFISDMIGLRVITIEGKYLGEVKDIISTGSNDVYKVSDESGNEILIPALKSVVNNISISEGFIEITLPKGLLEDM